MSGRRVVEEEEGGLAVAAEEDDASSSSASVSGALATRDDFCSAREMGQRESVAQRGRESEAHLERASGTLHALLHARNLGLDLLDELLDGVFARRRWTSTILAVAVGRLGRGRRRWGRSVGGGRSLERVAEGAQA